MKIQRFEPTCNLDTVRDSRGGIFTWIPSEPILEWNLLFFNPTKIRGNHYHPEFVEYLLVVDGYGVMVFRDTDGSECFLHLSTGQCVRTPKNVSHAFYAIKHTTAMAFLTKNWDKCNPPIQKEEVFLENKHD